VEFFDFWLPSLMTTPAPVLVFLLTLRLEPSVPMVKVSILPSRFLSRRLVFKVYSSRESFLGGFMIVT
jgi:hypothetical protein